MDDEGEKCYQAGKRYDLSQDSSPANGTLAKAAFQRGAHLGHTGCMRGLAGLLYYGVGGKGDRFEAMKLLWIAHQKNDREALPELADMLDHSAETVGNPENQRVLVTAAEHSRQIAKMTDALHDFLRIYKTQSESDTRK